MRILTPLFASYGKHVIVASNPFRVSSELCTSAGEYWPTGDWERLIRGLDRLEQRPEFSMLGVAVTRLHVQPGILEMMIRGQLLMQQAASRSGRRGEPAVRLNRQAPAVAATLRGGPAKLEDRAVPGSSRSRHS